MTRRIFSFDSPDRFVCGAIGQPGQRTFFLQASKNGNVVSVALEKAQVAVLAERLAILLLALREKGVPLADEDLLQAEGGPVQLIEPVEEEFRVGVLTLAWDEQRQRVVIEAREMTTEEMADEEQEGEASAASLFEPDELEGPDMVRVLLEPTEARSFVSGAVAVVQAGRPPCPMCGEPLEAAGHFCSRRNGYTH